MADWMPIETAPKDGRSVLLWRAPHAYVGKWADDYYCWAAPIFNRAPDEIRTVSLLGPEQGVFGIPGPTLWRPIDEPPL